MLNNRIFALLPLLVLAVAVVVSAAFAQSPISTPTVEVQLPVLGYIGDSNYGVEATISIQNVGTDTTKAVMFVFGETSNLCEPQAPGPRKVECTGVILPGSSWYLVSSKLPAGSKSAIVFSVPEGKKCDFVPGDFLGSSPNSAVLGTGEPLAVEVLRQGPGLPSGVRVVGDYNGITLAETGRPDPVFGGYAYYAPAIFANARGLNSWLYVQNSGTACTSVTLWFSQRDDCLRSQIAEVLSLAPGESVSFAAAQAVSAGFEGSVWIRSGQPLAIVVDQVGRDVLMSYRGYPSELNFTFNGVPLAASGSQVLFGPLFYREDQGWDTLLAVQNMSSIVKAKVKVYFLDHGGGIVANLVDWVCPRGSAFFYLPVVDMPHAVRVGSIRVESQEWWTPGDPKIQPPDINGVAMLFKYEGPMRSAILEAVAYNLLPEPQVFDWSLGLGGGGLESGVGVIAIPDLRRRAAGVTTDLAIQNAVPVPGGTNFRIFIYDQNGLIDFLDQYLNEKQVEYVNLEQWAFIQPGFRGSLVISATNWSHPVFADGKLVRNVLGLAAVKVERSGTVLGSDIPGDESAASEGFPLR